MMLRVNNEYLDFNQPVEMDRKVKLFEDISKTEGDVSYQFEIELTSENARKLGFPYPDTSTKTVYQMVPSDLENNEGQTISRGSIKVERKSGNILFCSFFGGNSTWFSLLTGSLQDLQGGSVNMTEANIRSSWTNTEGIIFPMVNNGMLGMRGHQRLTIEDFHPFLYVKTLVKTIFQKYSIKLEGELLQDWLYNNMIVSSGIQQEDQIQARRTLAQKTGSTPVDNTSIPIPFENVSSPFFGPSNYNATTGEYTAPYKMVVKANATVNFSDTGDLYQLNIYINNQPVPTKVSYSQTGEAIASIEFDILLEAAQVLTVNAEVRNAGGTANAIGGTLEITPLYILNVSSYAEFLPDWTELQFVSNIFNLLNVVSKYDPISRTLTANIFDKLKYKSPIDLSNHIEIKDTDYSDFVSKYGKKNRFLYDADPELYGSGVIVADNDFIDEVFDVVESEFKVNPSSRIQQFKTQLEFMEFREEYVYIDTEINSITDNSGIARFNVTSTSLISVNNLIRIETENGLYDGDYIVGTVGVGFFEISNLSFIANDTGTAERILQVPVTNTDLHLLVVIRDTAVPSFSDAANYYFYGTTISSMSYAYFNLYNEDRPINELYKQSLFFQSDGKENFYQRTLLDSYWGSFDRMINDPVKIIADAHLQWILHNRIDFLTPVVIRTKETTNLYYCNRELGYQNSYMPCELELIKLP